MRSILGAAVFAPLAALLPCAAGAAVDGTIQVGPDGVNVPFTEPGTKTYRVRLTKGAGYALTLIRYLPAILRDATGRTLAGASPGADTPGDSFRAPYTGDYFVDVTAPPEDSFPDDGGVAVDTDCL